MENVAQEVSLRLDGVFFQLQLRSDRLLWRQGSHMCLQQNVAITGEGFKVELGGIFLTITSIWHAISTLSHSQHFFV